MKLIDVNTFFNKDPDGGFLSLQKYTIQRRNEYTLHCFIQGEGILRIGKNQYPIQDSIKFITFPEEGYAINIFPNSKPVTYYGYTFRLTENDSDIISFFHTHLQKTRIFSLTRNHRMNLDEIKYKFDCSSEHSIKSAEHQIASIIYSLPEKKNTNTFTLETIEYIEYACELMREGIYRHLKLSEICSKLNITESHFIRIFKSYMGTSPMKYFTKMKTKEAARLLSETNESISQIAEKLNFSNESHLNRTFKQYLSVTPGQYRNNYIKTLEAKQKKSEQELEEAYTLLQKIIDATPDLIFYKDTNGILMGCNDAFSEIMGLPKEKIIGFSDFEIHPRDAAQFFTDRDQVIFQNDHPYKNEEWMTYPNGVKRRFEVYKAPFHDSNGNIIGLLGISRDITEREKNKEEMQKVAYDEQIANEQKTQFLLTMADEYLRSISRIQKLVIKYPHVNSSPNDLHLSLDKLLFECDYVSVLTKDIIDFIKYQSGEENIQIKGFSLINLLNRLKNSLQKNVKLRSSVNSRIHSEIPQIVFGDELRLQHLIVHLVNTALRNSQGGSIDFTCTYMKNTATFKITIWGVKFTKNKQESMLRAVNLKTENSFFNKGVDLSMLIAYRITIAMDGELTFEFQERDTLQYVLKINLPSDVESLDLYYSPKKSVTVR